MLRRGNRLTRSLFLRSFPNVAQPPPSKSTTMSYAGIASLAAAPHLVEPRPKVTTVPAFLQPRVLIYDGVCHLCHTGVRRVIKADKDAKIKFCCLQSKAAEPYLKACGLDREDVFKRFLFIEGPDQYDQGSTAALRVLSHLPLPYSALSHLMIIPTHLRDAVYDYVAERRYDWFGRGNDCLVLRDKQLLWRFIDREEILERERSGYEK